MKRIRSPTLENGLDKQTRIMYNTYCKQKQNNYKGVINMKKLNTTSIASSPIFSLEKGEIDEIKNFTLKHATIVPAENGGCMVAVTFNESNKRYWASGNFTEFITDNYDVDKVNETDLDFTPYGIKVTFTGKKTSKNNRKYNSWKIGYDYIE